MQTTLNGLFHHYSRSIWIKFLKLFKDYKLLEKTLNELAPDYLQCLFTQRHFKEYNLRNLQGKLSLPKPNTNYLKRSLCYRGACLWNNLPQDLKSVCSIGQFKRGIKKVSEISDPTRQSCKAVVQVLIFNY